MDNIKIKRKVRPTLIVGIGGTGTKTVKTAKKLFKDIHSRYSPIKDADKMMFPFIEFLSIDTDSEPENGVSLNGDEFIQIGNFNYEHILDDVKLHRGPFAYIDWLPNTNLGQIRRGVGGERRVGRLCYHKNRKNILEILSSKLTTLKSSRRDTITNMEYSSIEVLDEAGGIDIHLISSVCGGTGAGFLLNIAYDLYSHTVKETKVPPVVYLHLVLPEPFDPLVPEITKQQNRVNAYLTLNELDYFIHLTNWEEQYQDEKVHVESSPAQYIFLLGDQGKETKKDFIEMTSMISESIALMALTHEGENLIRVMVNLSTRLFCSKTSFYGKLKAYSTYGLSILELPQREEDLYSVVRDLISDGAKINVKEDKNYLKDLLSKYPELNSDHLLNSVEADIIIPNKINYSQRVSGLRISKPNTGFFGSKQSDTENARMCEIFKNNSIKTSSDILEKINDLLKLFSTELKNKLDMIINTFDDFIIAKWINIPEYLMLLNEIVKHIDEQLSNCQNEYSELIGKTKEIEADITNWSAGEERIKLQNRSIEKLDKTTKANTLTIIINYYESFKRGIVQLISNINELQHAIKSCTVPSSGRHIDQSIRLPLKTSDVLELDESVKMNIIREFWVDVHKELYSSQKGYKITKLSTQKVFIKELFEKLAKNLILQIRSGDVNIVDTLDEKKNTKEIIRSRFNDAAPAWRVRDNYLIEDLQKASYVNLPENPNFLKTIREAIGNELKPTEQSNKYELIFFRTQHGLALWGLETLIDYQKYFEKYRRTEKKKVEDLINDPRWKVELITLFEYSHEELSSLFSLAWYFKIIKVEISQTYSVNMNMRYILGVGREMAFDKFLLATNTGDISYSWIVNKIEEQIKLHVTLPEENDTQWKIDFLEKKILTYHKVVDKLIELKNRLQLVKDKITVEGEIKALENIKRHDEVTLYSINV
ncbi:MAG: tubulin-like doman-containing protein [bacterium]